MEESAAAAVSVVDDDVAGGCELIAVGEDALLFAEQDTKPFEMGRQVYRTFIPAAVIGNTLPSDNKVMGNPLSLQGSS